MHANIMTGISWHFALDHLCIITLCAACNHVQVLFWHCSVMFICITYTLYLHSAEHLFTVLTAYFERLVLRVCKHHFISVLFVSSSVYQIQYRTWPSVISKIHGKSLRMWKLHHNKGGYTLKSFWGSACYSSHSAIHFWRRATCSERNSVHYLSSRAAQLDKELKPDHFLWQQHNCMASALNRFPVCLQITSILQNGFVCTCMLIYCVNMGRFSGYSRVNIWGHWYTCV